MKKLFLVLSAVLLVACGGEGYKIEGVVDGVSDGAKVYMMALDEELSVVDSTVVADGEFVFSGGFHSRTVRMLLVDGKGAGGPVVLEPGVVKVAFTDVMSRGGTDGNDILQRFIDGEEHLKNLKYVTSPAFLAQFPLEESVLDSLAHARAAAEEKLSKYAAVAIDKNVDNALGTYILTRSYELLNIVLLDSFLDRVPLFLRDKRYEFVKEYASHRIVAARNKMATAVGKDFCDFELSDINGKNILFSAVVKNNTYTLLQFWASWCAPCRQELPKFVEVYNKYSRKGLAVVGISLDTSIEECKATVSAFKISWPQLCNPSGGSGEIASAYGVDALPANVLINNKGVIIARDLSAQELDSLFADSLNL